MNASWQTLFLRAYGMARMVLGVGQVVGLSAGYFLLEWVIRYPANSILYVINSEVLALTYMAVLLRAVFHIVAGIGIARMAGWARAWMAWGWPIIMFVTFGLFLSVANDLLMEGFVERMSLSLSWIKLLLYFTWCFADIFLIGAMISEVAVLKIKRDQEEPMLPFRTIATVFFVSVAVFVLLLFLGNPIKQGFHQGFYRSSGQKVEVKKRMTTSKREEKKSDESSLVPKESTEIQELLTPPKVVSISVEEEREIPESVQSQESRVTETQEEKVLSKKEGIPYRLVLGYAGALFLICGFLFQILGIEVQGQKIQVPLYPYVFLSIGFFIWIVYGLSFKLAPVVFAGFVCWILTIVIIFIRFK